jgi:hypothetical protein
MQAELAIARPLWDFAMILFALGMGSALSSRDRASWWLSQGVLLLSIVIGFAAVSATHAGANLFPLGVWLPIVWAVSFIGAFRTPQSSRENGTSHDGSL